MPSGGILPALGHAASGSVGAAIATAATYPLDLINTRLKVQRQLARDGRSAGDVYDGALDALQRILKEEGGVSALFVGLASDVAKSAADSFLFFLFYTWLRSLRLSARGGGRRGRGGGRLASVEELVLGAVAGAVARALTTPVANAVARMQASALAADRWNAKKGLVGELRQLWNEKGVQGLWAGYSATLVLTLNPGITFCLDQAIRSAAAGRGKKSRGGGGRGGGGGGGGGEGGDLGGFGMFLSAAISKAAATAITYPFQIAKARLQVSTMMSSSPGAPPRAPSPPRPPPPMFVPPVIIESAPSPEPTNKQTMAQDMAPRESDGLDDVHGDPPANRQQQQQQQHTDRDEVDSNHSHMSHMSHMTAEEGFGGLGIRHNKAVFMTPMIGSTPDDAVPVKEAVVSAAQTVSNGVTNLAQDNIFTMLAHISKKEGPGALYDGLAGELLRAFFSHGFMMLSKDLLHKLVVRLYFALVAVWRTLQTAPRPRDDHYVRDQALAPSFDTDPYPSSSAAAASHVPFGNAARGGRGPASNAGRYPTGREEREPVSYAGRYPTGHEEREPAGYRGGRGGPADYNRRGGPADYGSYEPGPSGHGGYEEGPRSYNSYNDGPGAHGSYQDGPGAYGGGPGGDRGDGRSRYVAEEPIGYRGREPAGYLRYHDSSMSQHGPPPSGPEERQMVVFGGERGNPRHMPPPPAGKVVKEAAKVFVANVMDSSRRMIKDRS